LLPSRLPVFRSVGNCLGAVKAYLDHHRFVADYSSPFTKPVTRRAPGAKRAASMLANGGALSEYDSKRLLREYGIPTTDDVVCTSAAEAVRAAEAIGYPVVMKVASAAASHKSELGFVKVGVKTARDVRQLFRDLTERATEALPGTTIDGVIVTNFISGGVETIVGVTADELFGPTVMFGIGGVAVEVYRDVTFRGPPFEKREARRVIHELRGLPLRTGARGAPKANLSARADASMRVQRLAIDLSAELVELDINPLVARPDRVVALDALAVGRRR